MAHIQLWEPIAVIVLAVVFFYFRRQQKQKAEAEEQALYARPSRARTAEEIHMDSRRRALATKPQNLGLDAKGTEPYGVLMEMGIQISVVTLACFVDGDASVYYKTGGGMIGGISHENVRNAAKAFVALAPKALPKMVKTTDFPLPGPDKIRFYVLTPQGVFTTETNRQALANAKSELGALFYSGQEVVAEMRQVQEQKQEEKEKEKEKKPAVTVPGYVTEDSESA
ncbi:MAG TPA: hypothetical protein VIC28_12525 [Thermoanaerobaculia bacterium]|jgi:hypothetical protein